MRADCIAGPMVTVPDLFRLLMSKQYGIGCESSTELLVRRNYNCETRWRLLRSVAQVLLY